MGPAERFDPVCAKGGVDMSDTLKRYVEEILRESSSEGKELVDLAAV
jgi:hypothetical protein